MQRLWQTHISTASKSMNNETQTMNHFASADQLETWLVNVNARFSVDYCTDARRRACSSITIQAQHAIDVSAYGKGQAKTVAQLWQEVSTACWPACN